MDHMQENILSPEEIKEANQGIKRKTRFIMPIVVLIVFVQAFVVGITPVSGNSMDPTFKDGEFVFVRRKLFVGDVKRNDVIITFKSGILLIKRVIALPGETIHVAKDGDIYINGEKVENPYGNSYNGYEYTGIDVKLGEDEYYVMGDNRMESGDSRFFGPIKKMWILGKVIGSRAK